MGTKVTLETDDGVSAEDVADVLEVVTQTRTLPELILVRA